MEAKTLPVRVYESPVGVAVQIVFPCVCYWPRSARRPASAQAVVPGDKLGSHGEGLRETTPTYLQKKRGLEYFLI